MFYALFGSFWTREGFFFCIKDKVLIEPACGSGATILGAVWAMRQKHIDCMRNSFFVAQDVDIRCVWMTYIQLSLYKVPAVVIHGNTLTGHEWERWYTPLVSIPIAGLNFTVRKSS